MLRIAVTMGDPAGIGPELIAHAASTPFGDGVQLVIVADPDILAHAGVRNAQRIDSLRDRSDARITMYWPHPPCPPVEPGRPNADAAPSVIAAIETAVGAALAGEVAAVVTMPIAKAVLQAAGFGFPGHTEFLAHLAAATPMSGPRGPVMMLAGADLKVALATIHVPLAAAPRAITREGLVQVGRVVDAALKSDFGLARPRLALCGLNPHAGESGAIGREEIEVVNPAAAQLRAEGVLIGDARAADSLFHAEARAGYDAVIALYHDQGLIPIKTLAFWDAVNLTLGLPIVRTSPDHGTAFDIAGRNRARPDSAIAAIGMAVDMARRRHGR